MEQARFTIFETEWGFAGFAAGRGGIVRLHLPVASRAVAMAAFRGTAFDSHFMMDVQKALRRYFEGRQVDFTRWPRVDTGHMGAFAAAVLSECRRLKYGWTITYGELAARAGAPAAARAVGMVLSRNPVPLIIPCHRIVRADGSLGGYSGEGGSRTKDRLLRMESAAGPL